MKKEMIILAVFFLIISSCALTKKDKPDTQPEDLIPANTTLHEFQVTACNSAHAHSTCDRLANLSLVTQKECCDELGKCCD